jgi:thiol:disulfide interchange protein
MRLKLHSWVSTALLVALLGCRAERVDGALASTAELHSEAATTPTAAAVPEAQPSGVPTSHMAWGDGITWRTWESALSVARTEGKAIGVVVYAEWCGRCKELAPVFATPEVASAARALVMVHQDQDEQPAWLKERLGAYGSYVPRVLFLSPDGKVRDDLTSGHPRFPYFYAPMITDKLVANMRAASAR